MLYISARATDVRMIHLVLPLFEMNEYPILGIAFVPGEE